VFVNGNQVFDLGIKDTLTILPVIGTIGYRFRGRTIGPFIGGGFGQYLFSEKTPFDDGSEHKWQKANSFHVLGGVELHATQGVGVAVQARYTRVPDALTNGVAALFNEGDLGGFQIGAKILVGR
jgi:opacity protein-like surface antigen